MNPVLFFAAVLHEAEPRGIDLVFFFSGLKGCRFLGLQAIAVLAGRRFERFGDRNGRGADACVFDIDTWSVNSLL